MVGREAMGISVRSVLLAALTPALAGVVGGTIGAAVAQAETCPNEQIRAEQTYASTLPGCRPTSRSRPWKRTSPAEGAAGFVQASPSGGGVTFYSILPFPGVGAAVSQVTYLSTRVGAPGEERWWTRGLMPQTPPGASGHVVGLNGLEHDDRRGKERGRA